MSMNINGSTPNTIQNLNLDITQQVLTTSNSNDITIPSTTSNDDGTSDSSVPSLPSPSSSNLTIVPTGLPSIGADIMALITEMSSEQRQTTMQQRVLESKAIVETIEDQADEMRTKAIVQLVIGVASGALSIAQGAYSMKMSMESPTTKDSALDDIDGNSTHTLDAGDLNIQNQTGDVGLDSPQQTQQADSLDVAQDIADGDGVGATGKNNDTDIDDTDDAVTKKSVDAGDINATKTEASSAENAQQTKQQESIDGAKDIAEGDTAAAKNTEDDDGDITDHEYKMAEEEATMNRLNKQQHLAKVEAFNSLMGGVTTIVDAANSAAGSFFEAEIKDMDAIIEEMRNVVTVCQSLEDSLKELISKSISTQDAIQQNMNQTRTKILG